MRKRVIIEKREYVCNTGSIVGSKCGSVRREPAVFFNDVDRVFGEVVFASGHFIAHHVCMRLQREGRLILASRGRGFPDYHVSEFVAGILETALFREPLDIVDDLFFVERTARDLRYLIKEFELRSVICPFGHFGCPSCNDLTKQCRAGRRGFVYAIFYLSPPIVRYAPFAPDVT